MPQPPPPPSPSASQSMQPLKPPSAQPSLRPALVVIAAGVCAALHVGKLAPAVTTLQAELGLTLVQAGFLLSLVQGAGMLLGLVFGAVADGLGARRSMLLGLAVLALASAAGGSAPGVQVLMACRVAEGFGFLLVVLPAPGLVRALVPPARVAAMLGVWGAYMPLATALALLLGPLCIAAFGWRLWWWGLAALSLLALLALRQAVPGRRAPGARGAAPAATPPALPWWLRLRLTLAAPGPWWVALCFAMYSGQWLAVIGFLPAIYMQAGVAAGATAVLTALVAASNIAGNLSAGRLLQGGVKPGALLATGFVVMGVTALLAFGAIGELAELQPWARYAALVCFSGFGGLIPATLFAQALRVAPGPHTVSTTVGWLQQWSALGQFAGPPLVAAVASAAGGWQFTWVATGTLALAGLVFSALLVHGMQAGIQAQGRRGR